MSKQQGVPIGCIVFILGSILLTVGAGFVNRYSYEKEKLNKLNEKPSSGPFIYESAQEIDGQIVRVVKNRETGKRFIMTVRDKDSTIVPLD